MARKRVVVDKAYFDHLVNKSHIFDGIFDKESTARISIQDMKDAASLQKQYAKKFLSDYSGDEFPYIEPKK